MIDKTAIADAIRARAEKRLAEEYDAAQERGEVATGSTGRGDKIVGDHNDVKPATAADLGLRRDEIHEARRLRDAEQADPGIINRSLKEMQRDEEHDEAQERGEVQTRGGDMVSNVGPSNNAPTAADLGVGGDNAKPATAADPFSKVRIETRCQPAPAAQPSSVPPVAAGGVGAVAGEARQRPGNRPFRQLASGAHRLDLASAGGKP